MLLRFLVAHMTTAPAFGVGTHAWRQRSHALTRLAGGVLLRAQSCRRMP
jgi:hypothetical protein